MKKFVIAILWLCIPLICFAQGQLSVDPAESEYETLFKEYLNLVDSFAKENNSGDIEKISQQFVETHKNFYIYEIYIWNNNLQTKNNLLFYKTYLRGAPVKLMAYPKIQYLAPGKINVSRQQQNYILIEYQPELVSYRMVILLNKS